MPPTGPACIKCGYRGQDSSDLQKHLARKKPCDPVIKNGQEGPYKCHCRRAYKTKQSLDNHIVKCKAARLIENPNLIQQLLEANQRQSEQIVQHQIAIRTMAAAIEALQNGRTIEQTMLDNCGEASSSSSSSASSSVSVNSSASNASMSDPKPADIINSFDDPKGCISMTLDRLVAAFDTKDMTPYFRYSYRDDAAAIKAAGNYLKVSFAALLKVAYASHSSRNAYLNPGRQDLVTVYVGDGRWEAKDLKFVFNKIVDDLRTQATHITREMRNSLPQHMKQNAMHIIDEWSHDNTYLFEEIGTQIIAHLKNMVPPK
jgi:hypothetical protein